MSGHTAAPEGIAGMDSMLGFNLRMAQLRFFEAFYRDFADAGISPAEYSILTMLAQCRGLRQGELAATLNIKRSNMTKVMRALEGRGLIRRSQPREDARAFQVKLTATGNALQKEMARTMPGHDRAAAGNLSVAEQNRLLELLRKLLRATDGPKGASPPGRSHESELSQ